MVLIVPPVSCCHDVTEKKRCIHRRKVPYGSPYRVRCRTRSDDDAHGSEPGLSAPAVPGEGARARAGRVHLVQWMQRANSGARSRGFAGVG